LAICLPLTFSLFAQIGPGTQFILEGIFAIVRVESHDHELAVVDVAQVFKVFHAPMVPLHEEHARHEAVGDKHAYTGKVLFAEESPQRLVESAHTVVSIRGGLAVGNTIEEVTIVRPFHPHTLHFSGAWLEVAKVLFS
jgi:hypothetical protein